MASLKTPLQVSCPNCQKGNLPGSPYCGRCGAPLEGVSAGMSNGAALAAGVPSDPMRRFSSEGQDPLVVQQAHVRASEILTSGEALEYVAVANRGSLTHAPDCAVATNKRIILYRKKVLGKVEQDDYYWRDVRSAVLKETRAGVTFVLETIQGWQLSIESMPKAQAWRLYEIAVAHSPKIAESLLKSTGPMDPDLARAVSLPSPAEPFLAPAPLPAPPVARLPQVDVPPSQDETPPISAEPVQQYPTPESVLQAILQQAARESGLPTRPMELSAAAFQAPVADAQPVTLSETTTDITMRSMPRLNSLEQIAVFSGPLTGNIASNASSGHLDSGDERAPQSPNGRAAQSPSAFGRSTNDNYEQLARDYGPPQPQQPPAPASRVRSYESDYADEALPLPGSNASGPLLEAAFDGAGTDFPSELVSGSLATQSLDAPSAPELADRITAVNLSGRPQSRTALNGRTRRPNGYSRPPAAAATRVEADDPVLKMKKLKEMLDAGLIDAADYEAKKADILSRL